MSKALARTMKLLAIIALLGLLAVACGGADDTTPMADDDVEGPETEVVDDDVEAPDAVDDDRETVTIGVLAPLSGAQAVLGQEMPIGARLAKRWIEENNLLTDYTIEIVEADTQAQPDAAVAAARELADQGVRIFVGVITSPNALAVVPVMEDIDGILLTTAAHAMQLTKENYSDHYFRITDNPYMRQRAQAALMLELYPDVQRWAMIGPDHAYGASTIDSFGSGLQAFGDASIEIVEDVRAPFGASDYRDAMSRVLASNPQGVFSSMYGGDAVTALQQSFGFGFFERIEVFADSANELLVPRALAEDTPAYWGAFHWYHGAYDNELSNFVRDAFIEEHGREPTGFTGEAFAAVLAVAAALEEGAEPETQSLINGLEGLEWDTPTGKRYIRPEDHQTIKDIVFVLVEGDPDAEEGWVARDTRTMWGEEFADPPTPGEPTDYDS
jgi:branched-chain amino acid transport system substrate-binding protein